MILRPLFGLLLCVSLPTEDAQPWTNARWYEDLSDQGLKPVLTTAFMIQGSELTVAIPRTGMPVGRPQILNWIAVPQPTSWLRSTGAFRCHSSRSRSGTKAPGASTTE